MRAHVAGSLLLALLLVAGGLLWRARLARAPLTEKDFVLLADFVNNTGDPVFECGAGSGQRSTTDTFL